MRKATYRDIGGPTGHLARLEPFQGNTMRARWITDMQGTRKYSVYSYDTLIAQWQDGRPLVPDTKYSVTTSRQQNLCRAWMGMQSWWHDSSHTHTTEAHNDTH